MTPNEQAALKRWIMHVVQIIILGTLSTLALGALKDDDDENTWFEQQLAYLLTSVFSEVTEVTPIYGWYGMYSRQKESLFVGENVLFNFEEFLRYGILTAFSSNKNEYKYDRGNYKGQYKYEVYLKKSLPIVRQIQKLSNTDMLTSYYRKVNPFL